MRFLGWELRPAERALLVAGRPVQVGSRAFDVLLVLATRHGRVVSKSELLDAAWPGVVVEENNISVQIAALRKLLGPRSIATIPGYGYQLVVSPDSAVARAPALAPAQGAPHAPDSAAAAGSLPAAADLVGRATDLEALAAQVGGAPLVSIIGTGGIGKTSVARAVLARNTVFAREDVHWIDLAPLRDGTQLVPLVAKALRIEFDSFLRPGVGLADVLSRARALIALDNCEHLIDAVSAFVRQVMDQAPGVHWLATSQEPLHLSGEVVYRLGPLDVPAPDSTLDEALTRGAFALLYRRVAAVDRHFAPHGDSLRKAIDLCRQLDGLPLAIEMAASRIATLGVQGVHERLGQRLGLLAGTRDAVPRQQTLQGMFDWSYELLSAPEQRVFRRLEPFSGGFTAAMAQAMADEEGDAQDKLDPWQTLESLSLLVEKSLVHRDVADPRRFFIFESARQYVRECLVDAGEFNAVRLRHARVVADALDPAGEDLERLRDDEWRARYVPERHNIRAALSVARDVREPDLLARLVTALARIDSFVRDANEIVHCNVPMDVLEQATPALRGPACLEFSWSHYLDGNRKTGTELALRALDDFESTGDTIGAYRALARLIRLYESRPGMAAQAQQSWERFRRIDPSTVPLRARLSCEITAGLQYSGKRSVARLEEMEALALRSGFDTLAAVCRVHLTDQLLIERRFEEALALAQRYLDAGERWVRVDAVLRTNQVLALVELGRVDDARAPARAALSKLPDAAFRLVALFALAAARGGNTVDAALMTGYSARVWRERDEQPDPAEAAVVEETTSLLRDALPPERLEELLQMGAALSTAAALQIALPE